MNAQEFTKRFEAAFPPSYREKPTRRYEWHIPRPGFLKKYGVKSFYFFDRPRGVNGLVSIKKGRLLNLAYSCLGPEEGYFEAGAWEGKSLIFAMLNNPLRPTFACDDYSEKYTKIAGPLQRLQRNLKRYRLDQHVRFFNEPFQEVVKKIPGPIGLYFYDAAHDEQSQYLGIKLAEPLLGDQALVVVDDWRVASDSNSGAKAGTERAIEESTNKWVLLYDLPARFNTDRAMWWNGLAVYSFKRSPAK